NNIKEFHIPDRIIFKLLENIELNIISAELNKKNRNLIIKNITEKEFTIKKVGTLHNSMVTVGGIDLKEINKKSMECKNKENLFFIGEILDVDGDTGGYNIQWAFTSANLAALRINEKK
ncbi:NAD(P)/FAD-dependent oxidoreductase, partial [Clostridiaceae bacterium HSG29]|nr:NAD(P)/FAD-dependent oxidoreductase [Clostridiaceae bacterium HSG29]